jgi:hypothetical protein
MKPETQAIPHTFAVWLKSLVYISPPANDMTFLSLRMSAPCVYRPLTKWQYRFARRPTLFEADDMLGR